MTSPAFTPVCVAGHKGNPEAVTGKDREGRRNRLKGARGRGTLEKEKPPIFGMIQRNGDVVIQMLPNVCQKAIEPLIKHSVLPGTLVYTDEYARDGDGDGFHEVHVNTMEGFWSLLRSWLRPH